MKNYNYQRKLLVLPEYGRHIHEMVDYLKTIEDRDERNKQAKSVIAVMGNLNTVLRDSAEFTHKLWDHLFLMADFQLDVDSPYPIPTHESLSPMPQKLSYPTKRILKRQYGKNIQKIIQSLESERTEANDAQISDTLNNIARYMRTKSFEYNQEHPNNEAIIKDIKRMSNHDISLDEVAISGLKSDYKQFQTNRPKKQNHTQNRGQNKQNNKQNNNKGRHQRK
ncbi:MAG: DUF4290 domain-containing protein [Rikenellaceae bacterium]